MNSSERNEIGDLRERMASTETNIRNMMNQLDSHMDRMDHSIRGINSKVDELHDMHMKAKGARWALGGLVTIAAGAIGWMSNHIGSFFPK